MEGQVWWALWRNEGQEDSPEELTIQLRSKHGVGDTGEDRREQGRLQFHCILGWVFRQIQLTKGREERQG